jgi:acyl-CoA thioesterase I
MNPLTSVLLVLLAFTLAAPAAADPIRIVAFGDSNTYGYGVVRKDAYPAKLERALRAKGYDVKVTNAGVNGDTTEGALKRLEWTVLENTNITIVEFGTNDRRAGRSTKRIRANLDLIVRRLRLFGSQVLLVSYRGADLSAVAAKHDALYFKWEVPRKPRYFVRGNPGNHLSARGYDVIVAKMLPQIETLIGRVRKKH